MAACPGRRFLSRYHHPFSVRCAALSHTEPGKAETEQTERRRFGDWLADQGCGHIVDLEAAARRAEYRAVEIIRGGRRPSSM
jgi:hypothetical protein